MVLFLLAGALSTAVYSAATQDEAQNQTASQGGRNIDADEIYRQITTGPSGDSIDNAKYAGDTLRDRHRERMRKIDELGRAMESAWAGETGRGAQRGAQPLRVWLEDSHTNLGTSGDALDNQRNAFSTVHHKVEPMPDKPPESGFRSDINPFTTDTDREISEYNRRAHANIDAFDEYYRSSSANSGRLPQYESMSTHPDNIDVATESGDKTTGDKTTGGKTTSDDRPVAENSQGTTDHEPRDTRTEDNTPERVAAHDNEDVRDSDHGTSVAGEASSQRDFASPAAADGDGSAHDTDVMRPPQPGHGADDPHSDTGLAGYTTPIRHPGTAGSELGGFGGGAATGAPPENGAHGAASPGGFGPNGAGSLGGGAVDGAAVPGGFGPRGSGSLSGDAASGAVTPGSGTGPGVSSRGHTSTGRGGGAGRAYGGDDEEHEREYLIEEDANELFGTDQKTPPPVIGE